MFKMFPKDRWFFEHFSKAGQGVHQAASVFVELLQNFHEQAAVTYVQRVKEIEHEGDRLTHEVIDRLNKSFLTPFDREDIYLLISRLDDVLDLVDSAASRILLYRIGTVPAELVKQVKVLQNATEVMYTLVKALQPRLSYVDLRQYFEDLHKLENEGDLLIREAVSVLFETEKDPIRVIKLKEIHEFVEAAIDKCEDVANVIEGICVKHA